MTEAGWQSVDQAGHHAFSDQRVGFEGQVGAMLLMGAERQHGDPVAACFG